MGKLYALCDVDFDSSKRKAIIVHTYKHFYLGNVFDEFKSIWDVHTRMVGFRGQEIISQLQRTIELQEQLGCHSDSSIDKTISNWEHGYFIPKVDNTQTNESDFKFKFVLYPKEVRLSIFLLHLRNFYQAIAKHPLAYFVDNDSCILIRNPQNGADCLLQQPNTIGLLLGIHMDSCTQGSTMSNNRTTRVKRSSLDEIQPFSN